LAWDASSILDADNYIFEGNADFYGSNAPSRGRFFGGWLAHSWTIDDWRQDMVARCVSATLLEHIP
jgi:hypothetical protein